MFRVSARSPALKPAPTIARGKLPLSTQWRGGRGVRLWGAAALLLPLAACLPIPGLFYIGQLSSHDQAIFREAASIEDVDTVDWPAPGAWLVVLVNQDHVPRAASAPTGSPIGSTMRTSTRTPSSKIRAIISR